MDEYGKDPLEVMEWPMQKRLLYTELMTNYRQQQQEYQQAVQSGDADADLGAHAGGHMPSAANLPDDVNPADVPTPEGVDNPYARAQEGTQAAAGGADGGAAVDGERITRRADADPDPAEQGAQYDMREIHPAVRKHGNVIRVRDDGDAADETADSDA